MKKYRDMNKEKDEEKNKTYRKEYYEKFKNVLKEKNQVYWEQNKTRLNPKIFCECCQCEVKKKNFKEHEQSKKHQNSLKTNN
jgi:hypothetical protein